MNEEPLSVSAVVRARARELVRFHPKEVVALAILGIALAAGSVLAYARSRPVPAAPLTPIAVSPSATGAPRIVVHIVGRVKKPGVYRFAEGARVVDLVRAAGGMARDADRAAINLARVLVDGEQIVVPDRGAHGPAGGAQPQQGAKLNINRATARDLEGLPGIGAVLAERIVQYREQHGPFRDVRDLMKVSGIGPRTFESIEPHVTV